MPISNKLRSFRFEREVLSDAAYSDVYLTMGQTEPKRSRLRVGSGFFVEGW